MKTKLMSLLSLLVIGTTAVYGSQTDRPQMNGKLKVTTLSPEEIRYTGKPYNKELGTYVFNFRNYDPQISRWTTSDPSGFPDGANNHVYVNNVVTAALDDNGQNIYMITNPNAVSGAGHGAMISGSGNSYTYQSYGSGSSGSGSSSGGSSDNVTTQSFTSLTSAMQSAASQGYQNVNVWNTSPSDDQTAQNAFSDYANDGNYNALNHNCQDAVNAALSAVNADHNPSDVPVTADKYDRIDSDDHGKISKYE